MYNGITGMAELACVTKALFTDTKALPLIDFNLSLIAKALPTWPTHLT